MGLPDPHTNGASDDGPVPLHGRPCPEIGPELFREGFGEELVETVRLDNWRTDHDLSADYERLREEVALAIRLEDDLVGRVREMVYPRLESSLASLGCRVREQLTIEALAEVHEKLLFAGGVEACEGRAYRHGTLALTIHQLVVNLTSYAGDGGTLTHRLFRRELCLDLGDPVADVMAALERRSLRGGLEPTAYDQLSELAERGILSYIERLVLLDRGQAVWRIGAGMPAPYQAFSSYTDLTILSIRLLRRLIEGHQKFVFVSRRPRHAGHLLTLANGLRPLEYLIVCTLDDHVRAYLDHMDVFQAPTVDAGWEEGGPALEPREWVERFRDEVAPQVVMGLYKATRPSPPRVFFAHRAHADLAARIAIADASLRETTGIPALLELARVNCEGAHGGRALDAIAEDAYAEAGDPFRYWRLD